MQRNIENFSKYTYDLLVVGGGINGASIAHLAAKAGIRTALLEKGDFASGASSKSTKLIHGGLRYLENFDFSLVYESLKERKTQLAAAPHLVKPLEFLIPVYKGDRRPLWMMRLGVFLYDLIAGPYRIASHRSLSKDQTLALEPGIQKEGLLGSVSYYDAQMDDARLCLENVLSAAEAGAHVANYVEVTAYMKEGGKVMGVKAVDRLSGKKFAVRAKKIIVTGGPWTNGLLKLDRADAKKRVRTTKGIHIVYKERLSEHALFIPSESDKRIFFVIPWLAHSLIGTTDTDYIGRPDDVKVEQRGVDYLMRETKRVFPGLDISPGKILSTFAGLRPLVRKGGSAGKVSRKHLFYESPSGLIFVVGGKYTTYRAVAEDCLKKVFKGFHSSGSFSIYGGGAILESVEDVAQNYGVDVRVVKKLMNLYGSRYGDVLALVKENPLLKEEVSTDPLVIKAQFVYAVQKEMARTVEDVTSRRFALNYLGPVSESCQKAAEAALA